MTSKALAPVVRAIFPLQAKSSCWILLAFKCLAAPAVRWGWAPLAP